MVRIIAFVLLVLALGFGFSWLADRPGELYIIWQGQRIEMTLMVAAVIVASLIFAVMLVWWIIRTIWTSPQSLSRYFRARKRDRGYQALSTGLIAVGSGDAPLARKMLDRTKGLIRVESEPLIQLLDAQACLIEGKTDDARKKFEAMVEDPETRELGLRGLYLEALRLGAHEAARHYAEQAAEKAPHLPWAAEATLDFRAQAGRFDDAIRLLETQRVLGGMDKKAHDRRKAVLLTGRALSRLDSDPKGAREDAVHALKLVPGFAPAATIAAKAYSRENNIKKAQQVLAAAFKVEPQMEVANAYVHSAAGAALDRLKLAERLEAIHPDSYEAQYAVAAAAFDAREFDKARAKAEAAARIDNRESAYLLMADIEEAETGDQGRVRHWLAQALKAPRDPEWVADGQVSEHWLPVSPVSGRLDAFEWKKAYIPQGRLEDGSRPSAENAFKSLPVAAVPAEDDDRNEDAVPPPPAEEVILSRQSEPASEVEQESAPEREPEQKPSPVIPIAATIVPTAVVASQPVMPAAKDVPEKHAVTQPKKSEGDNEPVPFFGRPPDDPGVKQRNDKQSNGFRLF